MIPIRIVPFGPLSDRLLQHLREEISTGFQHASDSVSISPERDPPHESVERSSSRINGNALLSELRKKTGRVPEKLLAITDRPLVDDQGDARYGLAQSPGKAAVITLKWFQPDQTTYDITEQFLERTTKEALHQLGHTFGLKHCGQSSCVMQRSTSLADLDRKPKTLCSSCLGRMD